MLAYNRSSHQSERDVKIGTFAKVSSPLIELAYAVEDAADSNAGDRTRALQGMAAAAQGYQLYDAVGKVTDAAARNTKVAADALKNGVAANPDDLQQGAVLAKAEAGVGFKTANASQNQSYADSRRNTLSAGGNLRLQSTEGNIRLQHTAATAGGTLSLDSAKDISLESGHSSRHRDGKNSSFGASVGVGVSVGAQTGVYVYAEAGATKGRQRLDAGSHNPTELNAGHIRLNSRGDTALKGATATANRIDADVKGRLNIESVQDTLSQTSKQSGAGARIQIALGSAWEASGNFNQSKASGSSNTVHTQSGLFAGDGGYHINADSVHLKGGAIASTAAKENNGLTANALTFEDIQNHSSYKATNVGLSGGYGGGLSSSEAFQQSPLGQASAVAGQSISQGPGYSPTLPQYESGSDSSITRATLSAGRLNIGGQETTTQALGINSDSSSAHRAVNALPDLAAITEKQQIVAKATADIVSAARTFSGNRQQAAAEERAKAEAEYEGRLKAQNDGSYEAFSQLSDIERQTILSSESEAYRNADTEAKNWGIGGSKSRAVNAGTILLTGILGGQTNLQTAANTLSPYASAAIGNTFGHGENQNEAAQMVGHFLLGATLSYINSGDPLSGGSAAVAAEKAATYLSRQYDDGQTAIDPVTGEFNPNLLPESVKDEIKSTTGVIAALVGATGDNGAALNTQISGVIGQNAAENNQAGRGFRTPQLIRNDLNIAAYNLQFAQVRSFIPNFNGFPTARNVDSEGRGIVTSAEVAQMRAFAEFLRTQPRGRSQAEYVARFNQSYSINSNSSQQTNHTSSLHDFRSLNENEFAFINSARTTFKNSQIWTAITRHRGELVIQRTDIPLTRENITRMKNGNAPFVRGSSGDWEPVVLHHVGRTTGQMIEISRSQNRYDTVTGGPLHIPGPGNPVRQSNYTNTYWKQRYQELLNTGKIQN
ncbi:hemagglutinin repeat-containing protein [Uruburuella testudinis]|uniref:Hemagglutinin repeat-containing protein n=1 Tax=Uruburuella testudinis TaxID=1282863 RepID=A0ABY4DUP9_9NEIS|nr:hemagglutinin repeat-containing protein [Uruburuella testudinis]UOO82750.1 hemagglutinin repeat-containing protein [Uruburuella testudinis]